MKWVEKRTRMCEKLRPHSEAIVHEQSITRKRESSHIRWMSLSRGVKYRNGMSASDQMLQLSASSIATTTSQRQCRRNLVRETSHAVPTRTTAGTTTEKSSRLMWRGESIRRGACAHEMIGSRTAKQTRRRASFGSWVRVTWVE